MTPTHNCEPRKPGSRSAAAGRLPAGKRSSRLSTIAAVEAAVVITVAAAETDGTRMVETELRLSLAVRCARQASVCATRARKNYPGLDQERQRAMGAAAPPPPSVPHDGRATP